MRMVQLADRVFAVREVDALVRHHLHMAAVHYGVVFVGDNILDGGLAGVEVVTHFIHVVGLASLRHYGASCPFAFQGVVYAFGEYGSRFHVILHVGGA